MNKFIITVIALFFMVCLVGFTLGGNLITTEEEMSEVVQLPLYTVVTYPNEIIFESKKKPLKTPFMHAEHITKLNVGCYICHHTKNVEEKCILCHNKDNKEVGKKLNSSKKAFHGNCVTCHKEFAEETGGSVRCRDCHIKKKKRILEGC